MTPPWWKEAVVYQIYPYSFKDSTGTGIGDLNGITSKLPYLKTLGVDVVWLSPIYTSPMKDMGYDISDYYSINSDMGTMQDWENLVEEAHKLGLKVVMDLVVNHTSDQHQWFQDSKAGGEKRDWYYWKGAKDGQEPNNWGAIFGGSCWKWDEKSQEYFMHVFDVSQPDLNWENPAVREAVWDVMKFWLEKGCDGFRMDVINCISKTPGFPDAPVIDPSSRYQYGLKHRFNGPKVLDYLQEMNDRVLQYYPGSFTVGETPGVDKPEQAIGYVQNAKLLQMIFHFEHMYMDIEDGKKCFYPRDWKLTELKDILGTFMDYMQKHDGWDSLYLENHDQPRILGRWANDTTYRLESAKMLAIFHATGRGTLFVYQGQELGMANPQHWKYDELRDLEEINFYDEEKAKRPEGADMEDILTKIQFVGRDNARTPMQWDDSESAGFTTGKPWIKTNPDYKVWNAKRQQGDKSSVLTFWTQLLKIRKEHPCLVHGWFTMLDQENESIYAYTRADDEGQYLVVCSFSKSDVAWTCPVKAGTLLIGNYTAGEEEGNTMNLRPYEARVYHLKL